MTGENLNNVDIRNPGNFRMTRMAASPADQVNIDSNSMNFRSNELIPSLKLSLSELRRLKAQLGQPVVCMPVGRAGQLPNMDVKTVKESRNVEEEEQTGWKREASRYSLSYASSNCSSSSPPSPGSPLAHVDSPYPPGPFVPADQLLARQPGQGNEFCGADQAKQVAEIDGRTSSSTSKLSRASSSSAPYSPGSFDPAATAWSSSSESNPARWSHSTLDGRTDPGSDLVVARADLVDLELSDIKKRSPVNDVDDQNDLELFKGVKARDTLDSLSLDEDASGLSKISGCVLLESGDSEDEVFRPEEAIVDGYLDPDHLDCLVDEDNVVRPFPLKLGAVRKSAKVALFNEAWQLEPTAPAVPAAPAAATDNLVRNLLQGEASRPRVDTLPTCLSPPASPGPSKANLNATAGNTISTFLFNHEELLRHNYYSCLRSDTAADHGSGQDENPPVPGEQAPRRLQHRHEEDPPHVQQQRPVHPGGEREGQRIPPLHEADESGLEPTSTHGCSAGKISVLEGGILHLEKGEESHRKEDADGQYEDEEPEESDEIWRADRQECESSHGEEDCSAGDADPGCEEEAGPAAGAEEEREGQNQALPPPLPLRRDAAVQQRVSERPDKIVIVPSALWLSELIDEFYCNEPFNSKTIKYGEKYCNDFKTPGENSNVPVNSPVSNSLPLCEGWELINAVKNKLYDVRLLTEKILDMSAESKNEVKRGKPRKVDGVRDDEWKLLQTGQSTQYKCVVCDVPFATLAYCKSHVAANHKLVDAVNLKKSKAVSVTAVKPKKPSMGPPAAKRAATEPAEKLQEDSADAESLAPSQNLLGLGDGYELGTQERSNPLGALEEQIALTENVLKPKKKSKAKRAKYSSEVEDLQRTLRGMCQKLEELEKEGVNRSYVDSSGTAQVRGGEPVLAPVEPELASGNEPKKFRCKYCLDKGETVELQEWDLVLHLDRQHLAPKVEAARAAYNIKRRELKDRMKGEVGESFTEEDMDDEMDTLDTDEEPEELQAEQESGADLFSQSSQFSNYNDGQSQVEHHSQIQSQTEGFMAALGSDPTKSSTLIDDNLETMKAEWQVQLAEAKQEIVNLKAVVVDLQGVDVSRLSVLNDLRMELDNESLCHAETKRTAQNMLEEGKMLTERYNNLLARVSEMDQNLIAATTQNDKLKENTSKAIGAMKNLRAENEDLKARKTPRNAADKKKDTDTIAKLSGQVGQLQARLNRSEKQFDSMRGKTFGINNSKCAAFETEGGCTLNECPDYHPTHQCKFFNEVDECPLGLACENSHRTADRLRTLSEREFLQNSAINQAKESVAAEIRQSMRLVSAPSQTGQAGNPRLEQVAAASKLAPLLIIDDDQMDVSTAPTASDSVDNAKANKNRQRRLAAKQRNQENAMKARMYEKQSSPVLAPNMGQGPDWGTGCATPTTAECPTPVPAGYVHSPETTGQAIQPLQPSRQGSFHSGSTPTSFEDAAMGRAPGGGVFLTQEQQEDMQRANANLYPQLTRAATARQPDSQSPVRLEDEPDCIHWMRGKCYHRAMARCTGTMGGFHDPKTFGRMTRPSPTQSTTPGAAQPPQRDHQVNTNSGKYLRMNPEQPQTRFVFPPAPVYGIQNMNMQQQQPPRPNSLQHSGRQPAPQQQQQFQPAHQTHNLLGLEVSPSTSFNNARALSETSAYLAAAAAAAPAVPAGPPTAAAAASSSAVPAAPQLDPLSPGPDNAGPGLAGPANSNTVNNFNNHVNFNNSVIGNFNSQNQKEHCDPIKSDFITNAASDKINSDDNAPKIADAKRKRGRRGGVFVNNSVKCDLKDDDIVIISANPRGLRSKLTSANDVLTKKKAKLGFFQETCLRKRDHIKIKNFEITSKVREKNNSGVTTCVADELKEVVIKVGQGEEDEDEYLVHRMDSKPPIVFINVYGCQDSKTSVEKIKARWEKIRNEIVFWQEAGDCVMVIGDLNCHIGDDMWGVEGNLSKISYGGKLVRKLLQDDKNDLVLLNSSDKCSGGPFTRYDPADPTKQSCLDLVMVSRDLERHVKFMLVDSKQEFAMRRVQKLKGKIKETLSDHFSIEVVLTGVKMKEKGERVPKTVTYNYKNPGGWKLYKILTNSVAPDISDIAEELSTRKISPNQADFETEKLIHEVKKIAFGLTSKTKRQMERLKGGSKCSRDEKLYAKRVKDLEHDIEQIEKHGGSAPMQKIWNIRKALGGGKAKNAERAAAVLHPTSGKLATTPAEIRDAHITHVVNTLENNPENDGNKELFAFRKDKHESRMKKQGDKLQISKKEFDAVIKKAVKKNKQFMKTITKAGDLFKSAVWKLQREFIRQERFPASYHKTTAVALYKGKGSSSDLNSYRYIHTKVWGGRLADMLVVNSFKTDLLNSVSGRQTGGMPGRSPMENVFCIKTTVGLNMNKNKITYISFYDLSKFFDRERTEDLAEKMFCAGIQGARYRTYHKLQQQTLISVKTPVGQSEERDVGAVIGQGAAGAALCSAQAMDIDLATAFVGFKNFITLKAVDEEDEDLPVEPCIYQDDIAHISETVPDCYEMHSRTSEAFNQKGLTVNAGKCGILVVGRGRAADIARQNLKENPVPTMGEPTKVKMSEKYLGTYLHQNGLKESVTACIDVRLARGKGAFEEVLRVMEEPLAKIAAPAMLALAVLKMAIEPMIIYCSEVWINISKADEQRLDDFQINCIRRILGAHKSCLKAGLLHESGMTRWSDVVKHKKLVWVYKLCRYEQDVMARKYWDKNFKMVDGKLVPHPNTLASEMVTICEDWNIPTPTSWCQSEDHFKEMVKMAAYSATFGWVQEKMDRSKTMRNRAKYNFAPGPSTANTQSYLRDSLPAARLSCQIRCNQLLVADTRPDPDNPACKCDCGEFLTTDHVISKKCEIYGRAVCPQVPKSATADFPNDFTNVSSLILAVKQFLAKKLDIEKISKETLNSNDQGESSSLLKCIKLPKSSRDYLLNLLERHKKDPVFSPENAEIPGQLSSFGNLNPNYCDEGNMYKIDNCNNPLVFTDFPNEPALTFADQLADETDDEEAGRTGGGRAGEGGGAGVERAERVCAATEHAVTGAPADQHGVRPPGVLQAGTAGSTQMQQSRGHPAPPAPLTLATSGKLMILPKMQPQPAPANTNPFQSEFSAGHGWSDKQDSVLPRERGGILERDDLEKICPSDGSLCTGKLRCSDGGDELRCQQAGDGRDDGWHEGRGGVAGPEGPARVLERSGQAPESPAAAELNEKHLWRQPSAHSRQTLHRGGEHVAARCAGPARGAPVPPVQPPTAPALQAPLLHRMCDSRPGEPRGAAGYPGHENGTGTGLLAHARPPAPAPASRRCPLPASASGCSTSAAPQPCSPGPSGRGSPAGGRSSTGRALGLTGPDPLKSGGAGLQAAGTHQTRYTQPEHKAPEVPHIPPVHESGEEAQAGAWHGKPRRSCEADEGEEETDRGGGGGRGVRGERDGGAGAAGPVVLHFTAPLWPPAVSAVPLQTAGGTSSDCVSGLSSHETLTQAQNYQTGDSKQAVHGVQAGGFYCNNTNNINHNINHLLSNELRSVRVVRTELQPEFDGPRSITVRAHLLAGRPGRTTHFPPTNPLNLLQATTNHSPVFIDNSLE